MGGAYVTLSLGNLGFLIRERVLGTETREISLILTGDVMLGRTVMSHSLDQVEDPIYPFRKVGEVLRAADLVFINLENPIVDGCPRHYGGFKFCADPAMVEGLTYAGVDVANLANNHSLNYGQDGLVQTVGYLGSAGIAATGLHPVRAVVIEEVSGVRFGFLGFELLSRKLKEEDLLLVRDSDGQVDVLVVGIHWGSEYTDRPSATQREWAQKLIDSGADVIAGHHPHWVQPFDYAQGPGGEKKVIFWSLGNFVFDQMWSERTRQGLAVKLTFKGKDLVGVEEMPIYMKNWAQPEFVVDRPRAGF